MGSVVFLIDDTLRSIIDFSEAHPDNQSVYGEKVEPSLMLVKDEGVYLMAPTKPRQMVEDGSRCVIAYAQGFDPTERDRSEVWDDARAACGGDDFCEAIPLTFFKNAIADGNTRVTIKLSENEMALEAA